MINRLWISGYYTASLAGGFLAWGGALSGIDGADSFGPIKNGAVLKPGSSYSSIARGNDLASVVRCQCPHRSYMEGLRFLNVSSQSFHDRVIPKEPSSDGEICISSPSYQKSTATRSFCTYQSAESTTGPKLEAILAPSTASVPTLQRNDGWTPSLC